MYAIVNTGGKQYKVATDDVITVEKIEGNEGDKVTLPVIFLNDGKKIVTDPDKLAKAKVTAQIVEQFKGEKQLVFKFHKRKRYRRLKGHRQQLTKLKIVKVQATSRSQEGCQGRGRGCCRGSRRRVDYTRNERVGIHNGTQKRTRFLP